MEQRRLRLGDIVDDYCPRERRVTNHAVVAMIEEDVKQTRCTTCDAEHAYKGARVPKRRKKETPAALYKEVLANLPETEPAPALAVQARVSPQIVNEVPDHLLAAVDAAAPGQPPGFSPQPEDTIHPSMHSDDNDQRDELPEPEPRIADDTPVVDGPVHRPLIRATLPRPEGQKDARPVPEFTMRHAPQRGSGHGNGHGGFRGERMRMRAGSGTGNGNTREPNGNRAPSAPRFHGNRPSGGGRPPMGRTGAPSGFRNGNGNNKRGRGSRG